MDIDKHQRKHYGLHQRRVERYAVLINKLYRKLVDDVIHATLGVIDVDTEQILQHSTYQRLVRQYRLDFARGMEKLIVSGIRHEWWGANEASKTLIRSVIPKGKQGVYLGRNAEAVEAFISRKREGGMSPSSRIWDMSERATDELTIALEIGLGEGMSAEELSREVRSLLREPKKLFHRVRDKEGTLKVSHPALSYHPGQGVYRSSYKNAMRLVRTEINMAYRTSEQERWQMLDFVVGYEVKRSGTGYPCELCDSLAGKYPKTFKWATWHPHCRCYAVPILKTEDELFSLAPSQGGQNEVKELPLGFVQWVESNKDRIQKSERQRTAPYWIRDNNNWLGGASKYSIQKEVKMMFKRAMEVGNEVQSLAERIARTHGASVTPVNYKSTASMIRKCESEGISPLEIKDAVRTTIVADINLEAIIEILQNDPSFIRYKYQSSDKFNGYSGHIINIRTSNDVVAEIQVNTSEMIYAKETPENAIRIIGSKRWEEISKEVNEPGGLRHQLYEQIRVLDEASDMVLISKLQEQSIAYYSLFN